MTGEVVAKAVALGWPQIEKVVAADLHGLESALLPLLRQLDDGPDEKGTIDAIFAVFEKYPAARDIFKDAVSRSGIVIKSVGSAVPLPRPVRYTSVPVFFATSRVATGDPQPSHHYGVGRADNSFGLVHVSIPDDHRMGKLEMPRWFRLEFHADPERHVLLLSVETFERSQFVNRVRSGVEQADKREVLIFVHGYNVTFEDAARRAAQLAYDMHFEGVPVLYSWPSEGSFEQYIVDANNVNWAQPKFQSFLDLVLQESGAPIVHIIAHSMGGRLVANAIEHFATTAAGGTGMFRQIVFAAPDIDGQTFRDQSAHFLRKAERITLYASSADRALSLSQGFQKYARAGQSGSDLVVVDSVDTIDASTVRTDFLSHSYFGDSDSILSDLFYLIRMGVGPKDRRHLAEKQRFGSVYWVFDPNL